MPWWWSKPLKAKRSLKSKKASPSRGVLSAGLDPVALAESYAQHGAHAISVLTDEKYFKGHLDLLAAIRARVSVPLLRKDFTIAESQILEAAAHGALDDLDEVEQGQAGLPRGQHRIVGSMGGREVLVVEALSDSSATGSTLDVEVEGEPSLRMSLTSGANAESSMATLAVNAIPSVLTSDPGLYTLPDLPPVHCWTSLGLMPADEDEFDDDV